MTKISIFTSLFIFFELYVIAATANETNYNFFLDVNVHYPSFQCGYHLPQSLNMLSEFLSLPGVDKCIGVNYINNGVTFHQSQQCVKISDENQQSIEDENELLEKLEQISKFINIFNAAFFNCTQVFKENSSALSGYYTMRAPNGSLISVFCEDNAYDNCSQVSKVNSSAISGYYMIRALNGSLISVYCDMEGSNCDDKGGWMRVGYLNMSEPNALCPPELYNYNFNSINHSLCDRFNSSSGGCNSTFFNTHGISYQHICGQVRGYQYRIADGIYPNDDNSNNSIDGYYVDGVSITHGNNPRKHIWSYICGQLEHGTNHQNCPCNNVSEATLPSYVGNDYYCESGAGLNNGWPNDVFTDILWDGQNCPGIEATCCTSPKMPWFLKTLSNFVTDNIEVRLCSSQGYPDEATPIDIIELLVR